MSPVIVAPETRLVNTPETPVILETSAVLPVIVAPDKLVYTPETPVNVVNCPASPVITTPERN